MGVAFQIFSIYREGFDGMIDAVSLPEKE